MQIVVSSCVLLMTTKKGCLGMQMRTGTCTYLIEGQLVCRTPANMFLYICCIFTSIALVFHKPSTWDYLLRFILVAIRMALKVRLAALVLLYERNMGSRNLCLVNYYCRIPSARHSRHLFFFLLFFCVIIDGSSLTLFIFYFQIVAKEPFQFSASQHVAGSPGWTARTFRGPCRELPRC